MASKSIDLLQPEELLPVKVKRSFFIKIGTIFLLVLYCLLVVAIFSFWLVVNRESQTIAQKIKIEEAKIVGLHQVESLQLLLKQRLSALTEVVEVDGLEPKYWLGYLDELVPEEVALEEINWDAKGTIGASGISSNAVVLANFLEKLKGETDKGKVASSTLISATRKEEGAYSFGLEIIVKE